MHKTYLLLLGVWKVKKKEKENVQKFILLASSMESGSQWLIIVKRYIRNRERRRERERGVLVYGGRTKKTDLFDFYSTSVVVKWGSRNSYTEDSYSWKRMCRRYSNSVSFLNRNYVILLDYMSDISLQGVTGLRLENRPKREDLQ